MAAVAAAIVVLGGLAAAGWHEHWPAAVFGQRPLTWRAAAAPLPAGAARTASQFAGLNDVACPSAGSCVGVGYYATGGNLGGDHALIETLSHGAWTAAAGPDVPDSSKVPFVNLGGVACPGEGSCVAVGSYFDSQNVDKLLVETLSGGTWAASAAALPGDADQSKAAFLSQVACPAPGTCVATGWYTDQNGDTQALIETLSGGTWTAARAPLPAGAVPHKVSPSLPTALFVVKCPAAGTCVATGDYTDANGFSRGLIETLSGGTWTAAQAPLPGDAKTADPTAYLWAITCPAAGTCVAAGHYTSRSGQSRGLIETQSGGRWVPAAAPLPADAAASQRWSENQPTGLSVAACPAAGTCLAAGSYTARNGAVEGVIETLSGGTWTAVRAPLPAGAASAKQYVFLDSATCPAVGDCVAVGGYRARNGSTQPLVETARPAR